MNDGYRLEGALVSFRMVYWMSDFKVVVEWKYERAQNGSNGRGREAGPPLFINKCASRLGAANPRSG